MMYCTAFCTATPLGSPTVLRRLRVGGAVVRRIASRTRACATVETKAEIRRRLHVPVMVEEIIEHYRGRSLHTFIDCTLGAGGHACAILDAIEIGTYIGIDKDEYALSHAKHALRDKRNVQFIHGNFRDISTLLGEEKIDGALVDLGVSSMQLDVPQRGFSFMRDGPLDMRMDSSAARTAADIVATATEDELCHLFRAYADDSRGRLNARRIVAARAKMPIVTTRQLANAIAPDGASGRSRTHPATLPFQALRIAVNDELGAVADALPQLIDVLQPEGKLCVLSFHSGEDRIVKNVFRDSQVVGGVDVCTRKAVIAKDQEVRANARSRSAKLRVVRKLAPGQSPSRTKRNKYSHLIGRNAR